MDKDIVIQVEHLTKDYGEGRGVFDISFDIPRGSVFGYCGTNGSGKTTTIRHIMGFLTPNKGKVTVNGLDALKDSEQIKSFIGYCPGEIAFPDVPTGTDFLKGQAKMLGMEDFTKAERVIKMLQLDPTANLKRMSKGMKQKTALVAAFMNDPEILILDEPTTGLDPLMRNAFVSLMLEEKAKGRTIFFSSHMFEELEETCDYVGLIKDGHLLEVVDMKALRENENRYYLIGFETNEEMQRFAFKKGKIPYRHSKRKDLVIVINKNDIQELLAYLKDFKISFFKQREYTLQNRFEELIVDNKEINV